MEAGAQEPIPAPARATYLLVVRDGVARFRHANSAGQAGELLREWLEWHDLLEAQGRLRFCGAVEEARPSQREEPEPVIGYLLVIASSPEEAAEVASGCPGITHGFTVEICRPFSPLPRRPRTQDPTHFPRSFILTD
jgi:hypothetical protein